MEKTRSLPPYMDTDRVEEEFGISQRTARKLLAENQLTGSFILGRWRVETLSILKYLKRKENIREEAHV